MAGGCRDAPSMAFAIGLCHVGSHGMCARCSCAAVGGGGNTGAGGSGACRDQRSGHGRLADFDALRAGLPRCEPSLPLGGRPTPAAWPVVRCGERPLGRVPGPPRRRALLRLPWSWRFGTILAEGVHPPPLRRRSECSPVVMEPQMPSVLAHRAVESAPTAGVRLCHPKCL